MLQMHCPDKSASQVSFRACSLMLCIQTQKVMMCPSGRRWPCCHTPLSGVRVQNSAPGQIVYLFLYQLSACHALNVALFQLVAQDTTGCTRPCASRQRRFRRPASAHFSCSARSQVAVMVSSIRRAFSDERLWPFPVVPARVADIQGMVLSDIFPAPRHFRLRKL